MKLIYNIFFNAGLKKAEFESVEPEFYKFNLHYIHFYSATVMAFFTVLAIISAVGKGFTQINVMIYLITAFGMFVLALISIWQRRQNLNDIRLTEILIYGFMSILYLESISLSLRHPEMPAVSYIGVLLVLPLLFADRPINISLHQLLFVVLFCILVKIYKTEEIAEIDIWNAVSFYFVSVLSTAVIMPVRIHSMLQTKKIAFLSEHDILTGIKNRNAYEIYTSECGNEIGKYPVCVYADVNGLHALNDKKGHSEGDIMLKTVAQSIKSVFGEENTYRMGGDEFAAFCEYTDEIELKAKIRDIKLYCENLGFFVSFGYAGPWDNCSSLYELVSTAEKQMYESKRSFYTEHKEFDRRVNRR